MQREMPKKIIELVIADLGDATRYLPYGAVAALLITGIVWIVLFLWKENKPEIRLLAVFFLSVFFSEVLFLTFLNREPGSRTQMELRLFGTFHSDACSISYVVENFLFFMPAGILFPLAFPKRFKSAGHIFLIFLISVMIEVLQHLTGRGYAQLDDVILNTLGAAVSFWFFCLVREKEELKGEERLGLIGKETGKTREKLL